MGLHFFCRVGLYDGLLRLFMTPKFIAIGLVPGVNRDNFGLSAVINPLSLLGLLPCTFQLTASQLRRRSL